MELQSNHTYNITDDGSRDYDRPIVLLVLELTSLFIIMISAFVANITAIAIILSVKTLRQTPHNLLILTLAVGDLGVVFTSMPFSVISSLDGGHFLQTHHGVCTFNGFCVIMFSIFNFTTIVAIAVDRVFIVTSAKVLQNGRLRVGIMIVFIWSFSIAVGLLPVTGLVSTMIYVHYTRHCTYKDDEEDDERFRIAMRTIISGFVLPALTVCYSIIAYFLWKQKQKLRALQGLGGNHCKLMGKVKVTDRSKTSSSTAITTDASCPSTTDGSIADEATTQTDSATIPQEKRDKIVARALPRSSTSVDQEVEPSNEEGEQSPSSVVSELTMEERSRDNKVDTASIVKREKKNFEVQKRVALIGFLLVLSQIFCWGPFFLVRAMSADVSESVGVFTMWSAYCVNVINPLIYAFMNRRARKELFTYFNIIKKKLQCRLDR
ncbi:alpha-2Db adrenergic receptor-like [Lytechinus pictus]|uniref:alpha-2Db adrenergic receptor-like n=1 Tax=Lytechinus pictus TaxID=7653 RepID=UPI0030BA16DC